MIDDHRSTTKMIEAHLLVARGGAGP